MVVVVDELCTSAAQINAVLGRTQVDVLMLEGSPEAFYEDVVDRTALAVHADTHAFAVLAFLEEPLVLIAGELAALIRVEDVGLAVFCQSLLQRLDAERRLHRDRDALAVVHIAILIIRFGLMTVEAVHADLTVLRIVPLTVETR